MSPVAIGLDALLILLLGCAMTIGVRLNRKLKDLKDSQLGFIKAVAELDQAAMRAEGGLSALREATTEAHDQLLNRIETARGLAARLDRVLPEAETAAADCRAAAEAAGDAAAGARRAATAAAAARPAPVRAEPEDEVVIAFRASVADPAAALTEADAEDRPGERAAALFLEARARRAAPLADIDEGADEPASRLARFKARRAEARSGAAA